MAAKQDGVVRDLSDMAMGGVSAMFATLFTNPLEVVKTRLQLQGELKSKSQHTIFYKSVPHGLFVIAKNEGFVALQNGLPAMLGFQFCLNTFR
jgi:solute carrier family 25, member 34/35